VGLLLGSFGARAAVPAVRGEYELFRRVNAAPVAISAARSRPDRTKARRLAREGAAWLSEGNFEKVRRQFLAAIAVDASIPEAYNGVGVTYRRRDDLPRAIDAYKKALAVDPDFGDAYYDMGCVHALQGSKGLSLGSLQTAAMNGYATAHGMDEDLDLERVRGEPGHRALVKARM
jgi:tetratricopeptide (TPR) repeat protein